MKKSRIIVLVLAVAIMFLFTACNSTDYKNAVTLLEEGNYAEAITAFEALADYKDSHEKLEEAKLEESEKLAERIEDQCRKDDQKRCCIPIMDPQGEQRICQDEEKVYGQKIGRQDFKKFAHVPPHSIRETVFPGYFIV